MVRTVNEKADWLTKQEAAKLVGVSERSIERLVADGKIHQRYLRVANRRPIAVLNPADIEKVKEETLAKIPPPVVEQNGNGHSHALVPRAKGSGDLAAMLLSTLQGKTDEKPARRFITLAEASQYVGLTQAYLRRLIDEGKLEAVRDVHIKVRRGDLDKL